jgi:hypothetical protein
MNNLFDGYSYLFGRFALQESLSFEFENKTIELLNNRRTFDPVAYVFDNIPVNKERFDLIELGNISDYVEVERFYNAHIIKKEVNTRPNEPCFVPADRSTFIYYGTTYNDLPKEFCIYKQTGNTDSCLKNKYNFKNLSVKGKIFYLLASSS